VERITNYISTVPAERMITNPPPVPPQWPAQGAISLSNLKVKYREELPFVLDGISLDIRPKEKIGIGVLQAAFSCLFC
jgi:ABC-type multidrug transport system fused ATPase/permease subunit